MRFCQLHDCHFKNNTIFLQKCTPWYLSAWIQCTRLTYHFKSIEAYNETRCTILSASHLTIFRKLSLSSGYWLKTVTTTRRTRFTPRRFARTCHVASVYVKKRRFCSSVDAFPRARSRKFFSQIIGDKLIQAGSV
ncbi:hypothetical protein PUN28_005964 [Cardiocondyla obscurior]|uniref:Uncharacterized protein n=1 Tax=Cardiocondyla obscurior TaxID=286306 RepID=A0AAW2G8W3_9HYME